MTYEKRTMIGQFFYANSHRLVKKNKETIILRLIDSFSLAKVQQDNNSVLSINPYHDIVVQESLPGQSIVEQDVALAFPLTYKPVPSYTSPPKTEFLSLESVP